MSLINFFRIGYQIEKDNSRDIYNKYQIGNLNSEVSITKNNLSQSVIENLLKFGFNLDQIMKAHKIYMFNNLDEAIFIMMKDNETGKYNHKFILNEKKNNLINKKDSNDNAVNNNLIIEMNQFDKNSYLNIMKTCFICGGLNNEHVDYEFKEIKLEIVDNHNCNDKSNNNNNHKNIIIDDIKNDVSENNQSISNSKINLNQIIENENENEGISKIISKRNIKNIDNDNNINKVVDNNNKEVEGADDEEDEKVEEYEDVVEEEKGEEKINKLELISIEDLNKQNNSNRINTASTNNISTIKNKKALMKSEIFIHIDRETLASFDDPKICTICFDVKNNGRNFTEFSCGHQFCNICIKFYLTTNIINGKV